MVTACEEIAKYEDLSDEQWHAIRRTGFGGSDAGPIMGASKYASAFSVCMEKSGIADSEYTSSEQAKVGTILEPYIRSGIFPAYMEEQGHTVEVLTPDAVYRSTREPSMIANVDGFAVVDGELAGLELKTGNSYVLSDWKSGAVPESYYWQCQHYMYVTGLTRWYLFGIIGNNRILRVIEANHEHMANLAAKCAKLWKLVEARDPMQFPAPEATAGDKAALDSYGLPLTDTEIDISEYEWLAKEYVALTAEIKKYEKEKERTKERLLQAMGSASQATAGDYRIKRSAFKTSRLDTKALKNDDPGLFARYSYESEQSRMTVKEAV